MGHNCSTLHRFISGAWRASSYLAMHPASFNICFSLSPFLKPVFGLRNCIFNLVLPLTSFVPLRLVIALTGTPMPPSPSPPPLPGNTLNGSSIPTRTSSRIDSYVGGLEMASRVSRHRLDEEGEGEKEREEMERNYARFSRGRRRGIVGLVAFAAVLARRSPCSSLPAFKNPREFSNLNSRD